MSVFQNSLASATRAGAQVQMQMVSDKLWKANSTAAADGSCFLLTRPLRASFAVRRDTRLAVGPRRWQHFGVNPVLDSLCVFYSTRLVLGHASPDRFGLWSVEQPA